MATVLTRHLQQVCQRPRVSTDTWVSLLALCVACSGAPLQNPTTPQLLGPSRFKKIQPTTRASWASFSSRSTPLQLATTPHSRHIPPTKQLHGADTHVAELLHQQRGPHFRYQFFVLVLFLITITKSMAREKVYFCSHFHGMDSMVGLTAIEAFATACSHISRGRSRDGEPQ